MIDNDSWFQLETYLTSYLPVSRHEDVAIVHPSVMVHCRIGQLMHLNANNTSDVEFVAFFQKKVEPLSTSTSKFANHSQLKRIVGWFSENIKKRPLDYPGNKNSIKLLIHSYFKFNFPTEIRFHQTSIFSPFWRFMTQEAASETADSKKNEVRCLLCCQVTGLKKRSIKSTVEAHLKKCPFITDFAKELLCTMQEDVKKNKQKVTVQGEEVTKVTNTDNCSMWIGEKRTDHLGKLQARNQGSVEKENLFDGSMIAPVAKRARVEHLVDTKKLADSAVEKIISLGSAFNSKPTDSDKFDLLARGLSESLLELSKSASLAGRRLDSSFGCCAHLEDIKKGASAALSKLNAVNISLYSEKKEGQNLSDLIDLLFDIQNNVGKIYVKAGLKSQNEQNPAERTQQLGPEEQSQNQHPGTNTSSQERIQHLEAGTYTSPEERIQHLQAVGSDSGMLPQLDSAFRDPSLFLGSPLEQHHVTDFGSGHQQHFNIPEQHFSIPEQRSTDGIGSWGNLFTSFDEGSAGSSAAAAGTSGNVMGGSHGAPPAFGP